MGWGYELNEKEKAGLPCLPLAMLLVVWHSLESSPDLVLFDHTISAFPVIARVTACATSKPEELSRSLPTHTVLILLSLAIVKQLCTPSFPGDDPRSQQLHTVPTSPEGPAGFSPAW